MPDFQLVAPFEPTGDQPQAIERLADGLAKGVRDQMLLGVTGLGQDLHDGPAIQKHQKPTLVLAHNKTLAAQLYSEFREFFPDNAVEYFVSYFDYYQPEAYLPRVGHVHREGLEPERGDRPAPPRGDPRAVRAARRDHRRVGVVHLRPRRAGRLRRHGPPAPDRRPVPARRRAPAPRRPPVPAQRRGPVPRAVPGARRHPRDRAGQRGDHRPGRVLRRRGRADHGARPADRRAARRAQGAQRLPGDPLRDAAATSSSSRSATSRREMEERVGQLEAEGRALEAARLRQRTTFDLEMLRELGYCSGVENYSRHLSQREPGSRPWTLLDYFPPDWLLIVDESHMTIPQVVGMYKNDRTRKEILVDFGFRLPSALDNRPLTFEEFEATVNQAIYVSATPGPYELERSRADRRAADPPHRHRRPADHGPADRGPDRRPARGDPRPGRARRAGARHDADQEDGRGPRRLPQGAGRQGPVPPLRGRHARAGRDPARPAARRVRRRSSGSTCCARASTCPEVTLVAILDADKEGFLRSAWSLIQMIGRAARNTGGEVDHVRRPRSRSR